MTVNEALHWSMSMLRLRSDSSENIVDQYPLAKAGVDLGQLSKWPDKGMVMTSRKGTLESSVERGRTSSVKPLPMGSWM